MMLLILIAAFMGTAFGATGPLYLFLGIYSIVPWGIAGVALGLWSGKGIAKTAPAGAVYGFTLSFAFMIAGYNGTASLLRRLPFFALIALFGSVCGLAAVLAGCTIRILLLRARHKI